MANKLNTHKKMKTYELSYFLPSETKMEDAQAFNAQVVAQIQKEGGLVIKAENPIPKTLAYQIKGQGSALWLNVEFSLEPDKLNLIEEKFKKDPSVIRYLIVIKKPKKQMRERTRTPKAAPVEEVKQEVAPEATQPKEEKEEKEEKVKKTDKKVELKDIDEELEQILKD